MDDGACPEVAYEACGCAWHTREAERVVLRVQLSIFRSWKVLMKRMAAFCKDFSNQAPVPLKDFIFCLLYQGTQPMQAQETGMIDHHAG